MGVGRVIGIAAGTVVILAVGAYGPATLLGPLPPSAVTVLDTPRPATAPVPPTMPTHGASAVTETADAAPFAVAGDTAPLPLAGIAKTITALVVLDEHPLAPEADGVTVPITSDDYLSYLDYQKAGARTVTVYTEDAWSLRGMLQALLLGSSNNHADTLARWSFGSVDGYVAAANAWLRQNGMTQTTVVDATGLGDGNVGTASDLSRLAAIALSNETIASLLSEPVTGLASRRGIENTTSYLPDQGVTGISLSYTDAAGLCLLFGGTVEVEGEPYRFFGAILREPDWDALDTDVTALMASARAGVTMSPVIAEGTPLVTIRTAWGDTAQGVAGPSSVRPRWVRAPLTLTPSIAPFSETTAGGTIGTVTADDGSEQTPVSIRADKRVADPGPLWRLANPVPVIGALIDSVSR